MHWRNYCPLGKLWAGEELHFKHQGFPISGSRLFIQPVCLCILTIVPVEEARGFYAATISLEANGVRWLLLKVHASFGCRK